MKALTILFFNLLISISSFATAGEPINTPLEDNSITVYFDNEKSETVAISIVDRAGFELLAENVQTKNRKSRKYNLKQLPNGIYTLKIDSDQKTVYKRIKTDRNSSVLLSEKVTYKPTTTFKNDKWKVTLMALGQDVEINIYDAEYEKVYEQKIKLILTHY